MPIRRRIDAFATDPDNAPQAVRSLEKDKNYAGFGGALAGFLSALNVPAMPSVLLPDINAQSLSQIAKSGGSSGDKARIPETSNSSDMELDTIARQRTIGNPNGSSISFNISGLYTSHSAVPRCDQIVNGEIARTGKSTTPGERSEASVVEAAQDSTGATPRFRMVVPHGLTESQESRSVVDEAESDELAASGAYKAPPKTSYSVPDGGGWLQNQSVQTDGRLQLAAGHQPLLIEPSTGRPEPRESLASTSATAIPAKSMGLITSNEGGSGKMRSGLTTGRNQPALESKNETGYESSSSHIASVLKIGHQANVQSEFAAARLKLWQSVTTDPQSRATVVNNATNATLNDSTQVVGSHEPLGIAQSTAPRNGVRSVLSDNHDQTGFHANWSTSGEAVHEHIDGQAISRVALVINRNLVTDSDGSRNSELYHVLGPDGHTLQLQQADGSAETVDPAVKPTAVNGNELGNRSLLFGINEGANGAAATIYDDKAVPEQAISHNPAVNEQTLDVAPAVRSQSAQSNGFQIRGTEVEADEGGTVGYTREMILGRPEDIIPLTHVQPHNIVALGRQPQDQTASGSDADGSPGRGSAIMSRLQPSGLEAAKQVHTQVVSNAHFNNEAQGNRQYGEQGTQSHQSVVGSAQNSDGINEGANGAAATKYDEEAVPEQAISHNPAVNEQTLGVTSAVRSQSVQSNGFQIRGTEVEADEGGTVGYTREMIVGRPDDIIPLTHAQPHNIVALGRQSQDQTASGSDADESPERGSAVISRLQPSGLETEKQVHTQAVSNAHFNNEAQGNRAYGEQETQSRQSMMGLEQDSGDVPVRRETSLWRPPAHEESRTRATPVSQNSLTARTDGSTRRFYSSQLRNVLAGEISRAANVNPNKATEHFHRGDATRGASQDTSICRPPQGPDHPELEKMASLKVELQTGGSVRANVRERSGGVEVRMMTNDSQAAGGLNGEVDGLRSSLGASGLKLQSFQVSYQSGQRQRPANEQPEEHSGSGQHSDNKGRIFTVSESNQ
jgi:Flagellar hook-length control protein FliK